MNLRIKRSTPASQIQNIHGVITLRLLSRVYCSGLGLSLTFDIITLTEGMGKESIRNGFWRTLNIGAKLCRYRTALEANGVPGQEDLEQTA